LPTGELAALAPFFSGFARPIPRPGAGKRNLAMTVFSGSLSVAARVGVGDLFKITGNYDDHAFIQDIAVGQPAFAGDMAGNQRIIGTFWGSALRVSVRVRRGQLSSSATLQTVAANVQLKKVEAQYEITGVGLGLEVLAQALSNIPSIGALDFSAFGRIDQLRFLLADTLERKPQQLTPLPIAVELRSDLPPNDIITDARSVRFAIIGIANRIALKTRLEDRPPWVDVGVVEQTYARLGVGDPTGSIPDSVREQAAGWTNS
jgi:hypothetical protein